MDHDLGLLAVHVANLQDDRGLVGADDHGEPIAQVPDPDRVAVGVKDVLLVQSVLDRGGAMIVRRLSKVTCRC